MAGWVFIKQTKNLKQFKHILPESINSESLARLTDLPRFFSLIKSVPEVTERYAMI